MHDNERGEIIVEKKRSPRGIIWTIVITMLVVVLAYLLFVWWNSTREGSTALPTESPGVSSSISPSPSASVSAPPDDTPSLSPSVTPTTAP